MHPSLANGFLFLFLLFYFILGKILAEMPPPDTTSFKEGFVVIVVSFFRINREKSLRNVVIMMVAKFLDDNKPKRHLKSDSHCFRLHRSYLNSLNFSKVGEIFRVESERTVYKIRERERKFLCCAHLLHKAGA